MAVKGPTRGEMIKQARTGAKLTQEKLAAQIDGLTGSDISKAERDEIDLTNAQLKAIAKITGVTQASLLNAVQVAPEASAAPAKAAAAKTTASKTTAAKTGTAKTTASKTSTSKTSTAKTAATKTTAAKTTAAKKTTPAVPASANISMKVTASEKKLIELYRAATSDQKKAATNLLKGESADLLTSLLGGGSKSSKAGDAIADGVTKTIMELFGGKL